MPVTPTSNFALTLDSLATMFSNSTHFQTWTGEANANDAKTHVYIAGVGQDEGAALAALRPYAIIWQESPVMNINTAAFATGEIHCILEANVAVANQGNHQDAMYEFLNNVEPVIADVMNASYEPGNLLIRNVNFDGVPQRSALCEGQDVDYHQWRMVFEYGLTS
jgi:hypothetical protein